MKIKTIFFSLCTLLLSTFIQAQVPEGINAERYNLCLNAGLDKDRGDMTPENFCQQWASSNSSQSSRYVLRSEIVVPSTLIQGMVPEGINTERYNLCMNEGLGKDRGYMTAENFCQQWASSNSSQSLGSETRNEIPIRCGNFGAMSPERCESYMQFLRMYGY